MRRSVIPFVALAFCGGLLLHCELGVPVRADTEGEACECPAPQEPVTLEAACELSHTIRGQPERYKFYAEFSDDRIRPESVLSVLLCDRRCFVQSTQEEVECIGCPPGMDCLPEQNSDGWAPREEIRCTLATALAVEDGRAIVPCSDPSRTWIYERVLLNLR